MSDTQRPLVTIGIPTYNRAAGNLQRALRCAMGQTYPNLEILVSDNCSTDNTAEVVQGIGDPRIRYVRQETNIGPHNNFNFLVKEAKGVYFLLFHDDDLIDPDMVEACMDAAADSPRFGIVRCGTREIDGEGRVRAEYPNGAADLSLDELLLAWFRGDTALYLCSTLFNTRALQDAGGFHSKTHLFQDMVAEVELAATHGHANVEAVKASFRRHADNHGGAVKTQAWVDDSVYLLQVIERVAGPRRNEVTKAAREWFSRKNYRHAARIPGLLERWKTYWAIYKAFDYSFSPLALRAERRRRELAAAGQASASTVPRQ